MGKTGKMKREKEKVEEDLTALVLSGYESGSSKASNRKAVPIPSGEKLVPAIKSSSSRGGGGGKQGKAKNKHRHVTWAPSVYDPVPSASTIERHKQPKLKSDSKKNQGKGGRKGR